MLPHAPKPERATKGIGRFGLPQFRPEMDDSHPGSSDMLKKTWTEVSTPTLTSKSGYGISRSDHQDDYDDLDIHEPPKKRLRSTASMLIDAALGTVILSGAVAFSAYQLLTGKSKRNFDETPLSSPPLSPLPAFEDGEDCSQEKEITQEQDDHDETSESVDLLDNSATSETSCLPRSVDSANRRSYYRTKTPRSYRSSRLSYCGTGSYQDTQPRGFLMPGRPNTGTEDTDETFLRMEAQLNSLISEGRRALHSRIEVWDEE
ncbi:hypothetical protein BGX31_007152 [Mortierella sp. GBA43]|nr:hypothetical protein BGX31_007152 [Mortierella sp. GBA43]